MKKNILTLFAIFMLVIIGCKPAQEVATEQPAVVQHAENQLVDWLQLYFKSFDLQKIQDSVFFYNTVELNLVGDKDKYQFVSYEDGGIRVKEEKIYRKIPKMTAGKLIDVVKNRAGEVIKMIISFDPNDAGFVLEFVVATNGFYICNGQPELRCWLKADIKKVSNTMTKTATGWKN